MKPSIIKFLLAENGLSNQDLAQSLECSKSSVSETIRRECRSERIERAVADELRMPVHEVFPDRYDAQGKLLPRKKKRRLGSPYQGLAEIQKYQSEMRAAEQVAA